MTSARLTPPQSQLYNRSVSRDAELTPAELELLIASDLFRDTPPGVLQNLLPLWKRRPLRAGETIMTAQQPGNVLYFILAGTVKIHALQEDGSDVFIDISIAGDAIGEMSIVDHATRSATATAIEPTTVLWIDRAPIETALNHDPTLARNIARIISARLRRATDRFQVMATRDSYGRVAHQVSLLSTRYGKRTDEGILIPIPLTQGDLADLVGLTRERVNRVIGRFKKEKILSVDSTNHITVHNSTLLSQYANR